MQNEFQLIRSRRKIISIQVLPSLQLLVRAPLEMPIEKITAFLAQKERWIRSARKRMQTRSACPTESKLDPAEVNMLKEQALTDLTARTEYYASILQVNYARITIRCQSTRWGSCSSKGNLSFNCLLMLMPPHVRDYVVAHELCHRKLMNHSPAFWAAVAQVFPDYTRAKSWLKENGYSILSRIK